MDEEYYKTGDFLRIKKGENLMRFAKLLITMTLALSLVLLPILPMGEADAATTYTIRYTTNYYNSNSPSKTYTTQTTYTLYYDMATGKYYLVPKSSPGNNKPTTPSQPNKPTKPVENPNPTPSRPEINQPVGSSQFEEKVVELVNRERVKAGLKTLAYDGQLGNVAKLKSEDMRDRNYFSHTSPTYGSPFDMMKKYGVNYRAAGENIAAGQTTPEQVVNAWMNSPGHRANILNSQYTHIGVGYAKGGSYGHYWTQMFISK